MKDVIVLKRRDSASSATYDRVTIAAAKNKACYIVTVRGPGEGFNISRLDEEETAGQMETLALALVCGGYERE